MDARFNEEHAQRLTLQRHAADRAQRVADLEAERDELRARLADIEGQEPICVVQMTTTGGRLRYNPDAAQLPEHGMPLYARPVPAIPDESLNCDVCGVACEDPWHYSAGDQRHLHACDACWPGVSPAAPAIPTGWKLVKSGALGGLFEYRDPLYGQVKCGVEWAEYPGSEFDEDGEIVC